MNKCNNFSIASTFIGYWGLVYTSMNGYYTLVLQVYSLLRLGLVELMTGGAEEFTAFGPVYEGYMLKSIH